MIQELSDRLHDTKSAKGKMLEADPDLERSMIIYWGIRKILPQYHELNTDKRTSSVQTTLDKFIFFAFFLFF